VKDDKIQGSETRISDHQASSFVIIPIDLPGSSNVQDPQENVVLKINFFHFNQIKI
jgi:hypothetical protein